MANIKPYTDEIQNAVYGEEVRSSIINALNKVNDDNNSYINLKNEVIQAKNNVDANVAEFDGKVASAVAETEALVSATTAGNTARTNLEKATTAGNTARTNLVSATSDATTVKSQVETATANARTAISNAETAKTNLDGSISNANTARSNLNTSISNSQTAKTNLDGSISTAGTVKTNIDNSISSSQTAKTNLDRSIANADTTRTNLSETINSASSSNDNLSNKIATAQSLDASLEQKNETASSYLSMLDERNATALSHLNDLHDENTEAVANIATLNQKNSEADDLIRELKQDINSVVKLESDTPADCVPVSNSDGTYTWKKGTSASLISDEWNSATTYKVGEYCIYNNKLWKSVVQHSGQTPSETATSYWKLVSLTSELGSLSSDLVNQKKNTSSDAKDTNYLTSIVRWKNYGITDANYCLMSGYRDTDNSWVNLPEGINHYGVLITIVANASDGSSLANYSWIFQFFINTDNGNAVYIRKNINYNPTNWTAWMQI